MALYHKFFLILLFSIFSFLSCFAQNVTFNSQADVDAFDGSTTALTGFLRINTTSTSDPIVDLSNLSNLTSINGSLKIENNTALASLNGLSNLASVGEYLEINQNDLLINLNGLSNVNLIQGRLDIHNNSKLTDCCSIQTILSTPDAIEGQIIIFNNPMECSYIEEIIEYTCVINTTSTNPPCNGIDIYAPNIFSPNGDNINDCFKPSFINSILTQL